MREIAGAGAEATIFIDYSLNGSKVVDKERSKKNYRHQDIDDVLRKMRTRKEAKILKTLEPLGFTPKILEQKDSNIIMEHVDGVQVKKLLDKKPQLARLIGNNLTKMHDMNIIHGDLTTSNMILVGKKLMFIDFGLSYNSSKIEDKAVDIHLFKQALESKHFRVFEKAYSDFLKGYTSQGKKEILERLNVVEQRGRYKEKI